MKKKNKLIVLFFAAFLIIVAIIASNGWIGSAISEKIWLEFVSKNIIHNLDRGNLIDYKISEEFDKFPPVPEKESLLLQEFTDQKESLDRLRDFNNETSLPFYPKGMQNIETYMDYAERGYVELAPLIAFNTLGLHRDSADADDISRTINLLEISARSGVLESRAFLADYYYEKSEEESGRCLEDETTLRTQTLRDCLSKSYYPLRAKSYYWGMAPVSFKSAFYRDENGSIKSTNLEKFEDTIGWLIGLKYKGYIPLGEKADELQ